NILDTYSVSWDAYDATTHTYGVDFQIFKANDSTSSPVETLLNIPNVASITAAPAWQFRGGAGAYIAGVPTHDGANNQDFVQFQGYDLLGNADAQAFQVHADLSAYAAGATNRITQQLAPGSTRPLTQIQFTQFGLGDTINRFAIGWNETVDDSAGTHDQV